MNPANTTIQISKINAIRLQKFGVFKESWDEVLSRVLAIAEANTK